MKKSAKYRKLKPHEMKKSFNTIYKKEEKLCCIKDVIWDNQIVFKKGDIYPIDKIEYAHHPSVKDSKQVTIYLPFYIINKKYGFGSRESFFTDEITCGGSGMSGSGYIGDFWKKI